LSIAKYREALLNENDPEKAVYLLQLSEKALADAIKAACDEDKLEGRKTCLIPSDLNRLSGAIQKQLKQVSSQLKKPLPTDFTLFSSQQYETRIKEILTREEELKVMNINDLKKILQLAIEAEGETLVMTRELSVLPEIKNEALDTLKSGQMSTLKIADRYLKEAYAIQKRAYENHECQKKTMERNTPLI